MKFMKKKAITFIILSLLFVNIHVSLENFDYSPQLEDEEETVISAANGKEPEISDTDDQNKEAKPEAKLEEKPQEAPKPNNYEKPETYDNKDLYEIKKGESHLSPKIVEKPTNFDKLQVGYSNIFGGGEAAAEEIIPDKYASYQEGLIIYKNLNAERIPRIYLDMRNFGFKCGFKKLCSNDEIFTHLPKENEEKARKSVQTFLGKTGNFTTPFSSCGHDVYEKDKIVSFCFSQAQELDSFAKNFDALNEKDFPSGGEVKELTEAKLMFSDGHAANEEKEVKIEAEGLHVGEALIRYEYIEALEGKKCQVVSNLPIVPFGFIAKNIISPRCVLKFKLNRIDTYMGSADANCVGIISFIKDKMVNECLKNKEKFKTEINQPNNGLWKGWAFYHKSSLKEQVGAVPVLVEVNLLSVNILEAKAEETPKQESQAEVKNEASSTSFLEVKNGENKIEYTNLKWLCNNDADCSVKEFVSLDGELEATAKKLTEVWKLSDLKHCTVISTNNPNADNHIVCVANYDDEVNFKLALSIAIDKQLVDSKIDKFSDIDKEKFKILYSNDLKGEFVEQIVEVTPEGIKNEKSETLIDYKKMEDISKAVCGIEYRYLSTPMFYQEINPLCCARIKTEMNNYICMQQQSKCYIPIRQFIQKAQKLCLKAKGFDTPTSGPANARQETYKIKFTPIDNYKYQGGVETYDGVISVSGDSLVIESQVEKDKKAEKVEFKLESLNFMCDSHKPCLLEEFVKKQDPFLDANSDKLWLESSIKLFWDQTGLKPIDCMVLVSDDNKLGLSTMILACSTENNGSNMRESIFEWYKKRVKELSKDEDVLKAPRKIANKEFSMNLIIVNESNDPKDVNPAKNLMKVSQEGIIYQSNKEYLFEYAHLLVPGKQEKNIKFKLETGELEMLKEKTLKSECCFKAWTNANTYFICFDQNPRCYSEKMSIYSFIFENLNNMQKKEEIEKKNKKKEVDVEVDPFDFGYKPDYKQFSEGFKIENLKLETVDDSKAGNWQGWVYYAPLTQRDLNVQVTPVYMELKDGQMAFKTDIMSKYPFKRLYLHEYDQLCERHCQPDEYFEAKKPTIEDYEDLVFLQKAITNVLSQIYKNDGKSCTVMDFISPVWEYGHSHIICAIEADLAPQIRRAIDIEYYNGLLTLDFATQIRTPYLQNDKYKGALIVDDVISNHNFFYLDNKGLVGTTEVLPGEEKPKNPEEGLFRVNYNDVSGDVYGNICSLWYRKLNFSQDVKNVIKDNNCCFRFFTKDKKKIELCTISKNGGTCIKGSRELMKGFKKYCVSKAKTAIKSINNEVEKLTDVYTAKTLDDSDNGVFHGFVYFGSALEPSKKPSRNPFYIKVGKKDIKFYRDHTKTKETDFKISLDNLRFNCGVNLCPPQDYFRYISQDKSLSKNSVKLHSVYRLFEDAYSLRDKINKDCFIIEDGKASYLLCAYIDKHVDLIKKAIVKAYSLGFSCKTISAPIEIDTREKFKVSIFDNGKETKETVVVNLKGISNPKDNKVLYKSNKLDKDPISGQKCAIWFKDLPTQVKSPKPECCFQFAISSNIITVCIDDRNICVGTSFRMLKALWLSCNNEATNFSVVGQSPDSEVLGNSFTPKENFKFNPANFKYDICSTSRNQAKIFPEKKINIDFMIDHFNDIAYSLPKYVYKGWFNMYVIEELGSPVFTKFYGELQPEGFKFFKSDKNKKFPDLTIRPDHLSMACGLTDACKPFEFFDKLQTYAPMATVDQYKSYINMMEKGSDEGCVVLQRERTYFLMCAHIRKTKSFIPDLQTQLDAVPGYIAQRQLLSKFYGDLLAKIVHSAHVAARKYLNHEKLPSGNNSYFKVRITNKANSDPKNNNVKEYSKVKIQNGEVVDEKAQIFKASELQTCKIYVNLVFLPNNLDYNNKQACCIKFFKNGKQYACFDTLNCEYDSLRFANQLNKDCLESKGKKDDLVINEMRMGEQVKIMKIIAKVISQKLDIKDKAQLNPNNELSSEQLTTLHRSLVIKHLYKIKEIRDLFATTQIVNSSEKSVYDKSKPFVALYKGESFGEKATTVYVALEMINYNLDKMTFGSLRDILFYKSEEFSSAIHPKTKITILRYKSKEGGADAFAVIQDSSLTVTNSLKDLKNGLIDVLSKIDSGTLANLGFSLQ